MKTIYDMKTGIIGVFLAALSVMFANGACAETPEGSWQGSLKVNGVQLPLVFNFESGADGSLQCTLDSPMQGAKGIPATVIYCSADSLSVEIKSIGARFDGKVTDSCIDGTFTQMGVPLPLSLTPEKPVQERRPQTPQPPFPYRTIDTTFTAADGVVMAGTLTLPADMKSSTTAVVMVTGSGAQNRDEEILDHRPFAVIADCLARAGIASLRYDDRGTARSGGTFADADFDTFCSDAAAALNFLKSLDGIGKTGIIGHSEGGAVALRLAADHLADFAVTLAAPVQYGKDIIMQQNRYAIDRIGLSDKQKQDCMTLVGAMLDDIMADSGKPSLMPAEYAGRNNLDIPPAVLKSLADNMSAANTRYFRKLLMLNPGEWLGDIKCPLFALNGELDMQVDATANLAIIAEKVKHGKVKKYPALNHLFQHAATGAPAEYGLIEETISPEVLQDMADFILSPERK